MYCIILLFCAKAHYINKEDSHYNVNSQFQPEMIHLKKLTVRKSLPGRLKRGQLSLGLVIQVLRWYCLFLCRGLSKKIKNKNIKLSTRIYCIYTDDVGHFNPNNLKTFSLFFLPLIPLNSSSPKISLQLRLWVEVPNVLTQKRTFRSLQAKWQSGPAEETHSKGYIGAVWFRYFRCVSLGLRSNSQKKKNYVLCLFLNIFLDLDVKHHEVNIEVNVIMQRWMLLMWVYRGETTMSQRRTTKSAS